jgi:ketosteroid isomerase-like protein
VTAEEESAIHNARMPSQRSIIEASELSTLRTLNDDYIRAIERSDVERFREILADDFVCSLPNGSHVDRDKFLEHVAEPSTITNLEAHDVNVRLMGDIAIVHARTTFRMRNGQPGASLYTDIWARRDGRWVAVSAHVTRY